MYMVFPRPEESISTKEKSEVDILVLSSGL